MARPKTVDECEIRIVDAERVAHVRAHAAEPASIEALADTFALLGDPNRVRLLSCLLEAGELCVCDLAAATSMSESAVSHALRLMRAHRVVKARRAGRMIYYSLLDGHVRMLLDVALEHARHEDVTPKATRKRSRSA